MTGSITLKAYAKVNLALHVTGLRDDGYHLLDSLVVFAQDVFDVVTIRPANCVTIDVDGPFAQGVPRDARNLCWRAADLFGAPVAIHLEKNLPHEAGIGGGSADGAAVIRAMERLFPDQRRALDLARLGADVPVCYSAQAAHMRGIGEHVTPINVPPLFGVLVNPRRSVPTMAVFSELKSKINPKMMQWERRHSFVKWLRAQRNDLQDPAVSIAPEIADVLAQLGNADLARMSGSGATCFGLFHDLSVARSEAARIASERPNWWVAPTRFI